MASVHEQSKEGYARGDLYDKLRPRYPPEVLSQIRELVKPKEQLNIVEIGCGSGLFTRALLEQWTSSIKALKCYDPNEGMLKAFREVIHDPRVSAAEGTFSSTDVENGWADLIVIATAFHWCLDLEAAIKEFVRILKPDGAVCLLWNGEDREKAGWFKELFETAILMPSKDGKTAHDYKSWEKVFDMPVYKEHFNPPEHTTVHYNTTGTIELMRERVKTWSPIAVLSEEKKAEFLETVEQVIKKGEGVVWVNKDEGTLEIPFAVPVGIMKRKDAESLSGSSQHSRTGVRQEVNVHPQSQEGYGIGKSELYEKVRRRYDKQVLLRIRDAIGFADNLRVVEIGCGSGLFTRAMLQYWSSSLKAVKCYDPNDGMLKVFREVVHDPRVSIAKGAFESTDVDDGWADLVIVATAIHWCLDIEGAAKEFARILKPSGTLCFLWNSGDRDVGWVREMITLASTSPADMPKHDYNAWQRFYDLPIYKDNFHPKEEFTVKYTSTGTLEGETQQAMSWSSTASLDESGKQVVREKIKEIIEKGDGLMWISKEEGTFEVPFAVPVVIMKRKNTE